MIDISEGSYGELIAEDINEFDGSSMSNIVPFPDRFPWQAHY